jgi:hypothetical protein
VKKFLFVFLLLFTPFKKSGLCYTQLYRIYFGCIWGFFLALRAEEKKEEKMPAAERLIDSPEGILIFFALNTLLVVVFRPRMTNLGYAALIQYALLGAVAGPWFWFGLSEQSWGGLYNVVLLGIVCCFHAMYRGRTLEPLVSGLFQRDKYGIVLIFGLLKLLKYMDAYTPNLAWWHVLQLLCLTCVFFFNTDTVFNRRISHLAALGVFAVISVCDFIVNPYPLRAMGSAHYLCSAFLLSVAFFAFNVHINSLPQEEQEAFDKSQHEKVTDFTASMTNIVFLVEMVLMAQIL